MVKGGMLSIQSLTPREQEVLALIAQGLCNKDICQRLGIISRTVEKHLTSIFRKLDVINRTEAACFYWKSISMVR